MEEGEVQISSLIPQLFHFLVEMTLSGKSNNRTLLGPYYGYQLTKYSISKS